MGHGRWPYTHIRAPLAGQEVGRRTCVVDPGGNGGGRRVNMTGKQCLHVLNSPNKFFKKLKTCLREKFIAINSNIKKY